MKQFMIFWKNTENRKSAMEEPFIIHSGGLIKKINWMRDFGFMVMTITWLYPFGVVWTGKTKLQISFSELLMKAEHF